MAAACEPDEKIRRFLARHHVLTLATVDGQGEAWCSNAFYALDRQRALLVIASNGETAHAAHMKAHCKVAASVVLETRIVGRVQGCQIRGTARQADDEARRCYLRRFPYAAAMSDAEFWAIGIDYVKLTDNTLGFGKKLIWQRDSDSEL